MSNTYKIIQYHTSWSNYDRNYQVADLAIDNIDEIAYAFFDLRQNPQGFYVPTTGDSWADTDQRFTGTKKSVQPLDNWNDNNSVYGNFGQFLKLKKQGKKFALTLSVGGWTWSKNFSLAVRTPQARQAFVNETISLFKKYDFFNGINIDWEYISNNGVNYGESGNITHPDDDKNCLELVKLLRSSFNANGMTKHTISVCTVAAPEKIKFDVKSYVPYVDEFHVMTYDFAGAWDLSNTTHHTNVYKTEYTPYSVDTAVNEFLKLGIPSRKLFIGVAFYSRGFGGTAGLGKPAGSNSPDKSWENGIVDYKALPVAGSTEFYDEKAGAAYSYDPIRRVFNSYDNVRSVTEKCNYIKKHNLGGVLVWESSGDHPVSNPRSLTKCLYDNLKNGQAPSPNPPSTPVEPPKPVEPSPTQPPKPVDPSPTEPPKPTEPSNPQDPMTTYRWQPNKSYVLGNIVIYDGKYYTIIQPHTSLVGWEPPVTLGILWKLTDAPQIPTPPTPPEPSVPTPPTPEEPEPSVPTPPTPEEQQNPPTSQVDLDALMKKLVIKLDFEGKEYKYKNF
jgi:chitinase